MGLMSNGMDEQQGTSDDFQVASYSVLVSEQSAQDIQPTPVPAQINLAENTGAITGTVEDATGAVIPNAEIEATREETGEKFVADTDEAGRFAVKDLKPGTYKVVGYSQGFQALMLTAVPVQAGTLTEVTSSFPLPRLEDAPKPSFSDQT